MNKHLLTAITTASILLCTNIHAANLVLNPGFDTNANWSQTFGTGTVAFDSGNGNPAPSILLTASDNISNVGVYSDCIALSGPQSVTLTADAQGHVWGGSVTLMGYTADAACSGIGSELGNAYGPEPTTGWGAMTGTVSLYAGVQSVRVRLETEPNGMTGPSSVSFDNISLVLATVPVVLQSFEVN